MDLIVFVGFSVDVALYTYFIPRDFGRGEIKISFFNHMPVIHILSITVIEEQNSPPGNMCVCCLRVSSLLCQPSHCGCWTYN